MVSNGTAFHIPLGLRKLPDFDLFKKITPLSGQN
jgi:hypothetical protein